MATSEFKPCLEKRKKILREKCYREPEYWMSMVVVTILIILAVLIMVSTAILIKSNLPNDIFDRGTKAFVIICAGICFACVPFLIAVGIRNYAKYKCGLPYSSYANGTLVLDDDELRYEFWRVGSREPAAYSSKKAVYNEEDKFVFVVKKSAIRSIGVENGICTVNGMGITKMPDWAVEGATVTERFERASFLLAFCEDDIEKKINMWVSEG